MKELFRCFYVLFLLSILFPLSVCCMIPVAIKNAFRRVVAMMYEELIDTVQKI